MLDFFIRFFETKSNSILNYVEMVIELEDRLKSLRKKWEDIYSIYNSTLWHYIDDKKQEIL